MKPIPLLLLSLSLFLAGCGETGPTEPAVYESPPALTVTCGGQETTALLGTFSWRYDRQDGTSAGLEADALHPLASLEYMTRVETTSPTATLTFEVPPDTIQAVCWSEDPAQWNLRCLTEGVDPMYAAIPQEIPVTDGELEPKPGAYLYEVTAQWEDDQRGWGGTAHYSFWIDHL